MRFDLLAQPAANNPARMLITTVVLILVSLRYCTAVDVFANGGHRVGVGFTLGSTGWEVQANRVISRILVKWVGEL